MVLRVPHAEETLRNGEAVAVAVVHGVGRPDQVLEVVAREVGVRLQAGYGSFCQKWASRYSNGVCMYVFKWQR